MRRRSSSPLAPLVPTLHLERRQVIRRRGTRRVRLLSGFRFVPVALWTCRRAFSPLSAHRPPPTDFRLPTSDFRLPTSALRFSLSDLRALRERCWRWSRKRASLRIRPTLFSVAAPAAMQSALRRVPRLRDAGGGPGKERALPKEALPRSAFRSPLSALRPLTSDL